MHYAVNVRSECVARDIERFMVRGVSFLKQNGWWFVLTGEVVDNFNFGFSEAF